MDMLTVALPASVSIRPGDRMTLLSRHPEDPHSVQNTAHLLATIPYEVTCALNRRVTRTYA
jgi:alanine racemase